MEFTTLGRTGLSVSVAGLGGGGHSRLGQTQGKSRAESIAVVHAALDLGINFIDTADRYGTESIIGEALSGRRDTVILGTKTHIMSPPFSTDVPYSTGAEITGRLEASLRELRTDYVDIFHLHGVEAHQYDHCVQTVLPVLERLRDQGKIRFLGITERFIADTGHAMLARAMPDGVFDVAMLGFNMLNPSARRRVLPATIRNRVGTLCMFAVRRGLTREDNVLEQLRLGMSQGQIAPSVLAEGSPLAFLLEDGVARTLTEAAYRFCRHEAGIDVVLTGTGNIGHLRQNVADITKPPLPGPALERLEAIFGRVDTLSGN